MAGKDNTAPSNGTAAPNAAENSGISPEEVQKMYDEAQAMYEETKKMFAEIKAGQASGQTTSKTDDEIDPETAAILAGIKANEKRMKEKVPVKVDIDSMNRSNKYLFCGVGMEAVKIERGKTVKVSRAMRDAIEASKNQQEKAAQLMDTRSEEWDPDAWKK